MKERMIFLERTELFIIYIHYTYLTSALAFNYDCSIALNKYKSSCSLTAQADILFMTPKYSSFFTFVKNYTTFFKERREESLLKNELVVSPINLLFQVNCIAYIINYLSFLNISFLVYSIKKSLT